jgi:transposase-like protein
MEDHQQPIDASEDLSLFCCQNRKCIAFGSRGAGNLVVRDRIGKQKQTRLLYCKICKKRFVETKGTVFYRAHKPRQKVISILQHVQEGNGMRQTGRLEQVKEDTVIRYAKLAGKHAKEVHQQKVALSPSDPRSATG